MGAIFSSADLGIGNDVPVPTNKKIFTSDELGITPDIPTTTLPDNYTAQKPDLKLSEAIVPHSTRSAELRPGAGAGERLMALASDIGSIPARAVLGVESGLGGAWGGMQRGAGQGGLGGAVSQGYEQFKRGMAGTEGEGAGLGKLVGDIATTPGLIVPGIGQGAGVLAKLAAKAPLIAKLAPVIAKAIPAAVKGTAEMVPFTAGQQAQSIGKGEEKGIGQRAGEVAVNEGLGAVIPGGGSVVKSGIGELAKITGILTGKKLGDLSLEQIAANAAAKRAGIPLLGEQAVAPINTGAPSGTAGTITRLVSTLPGGRGVMDKYRQSVQKVVLDRMSALRGAKTGEELADNAIDAVHNKLGALNDEFTSAYSEISVKGTKAMGIRSFDSNKIADGLVKSVNQTRKVIDTKTGEIAGDVATGLRPNVKETIKSFIDETRALANTSDSKRYEVFRDMKTTLGKEAFDNPDLSQPERTILQNLYKYAKEEERNYIATFSDFFKTPRDKLLKLLDDTDQFYSSIKPIRDFTAKVTGYGREAGEKGFVDSQAALDKMLAPGNRQALQAFMALNDDSANEALRAGLVGKLFDRAKIDDGKALSTIKLSNQVDAYGEDALRNVLGNEKVDRIKDLIVGMRRARVDKLKFADPTNTSGTAAALTEKILVGGIPGLAGIGGFFNPAVWGAGAVAGAGMLVNRGIAKMITSGAKNVARGAVESGEPGLSGITRRLGSERGSGAVPIMAGTAAGGGAGLTAAGLADRIRKDKSPQISDLTNTIKPQYTLSDLAKKINGRRIK